MSSRLISITDLTISQLQEMVQSFDEPEFRAKQLLHWVYGRLSSSYDEMTDVPQTFRERLQRESRLHTLSALDKVTGSDGTTKILFELVDGKTIESILMPYPKIKGKPRFTVCVSTQVGCPIKCPFCATGQYGLERNLTPGEIIDQVLYFAGHLRGQGEDRRKSGNEPVNIITNVVFMGMGEPLASFDNLWQAIEMLNLPQAFGLGARNMVISTAGLVPQIKRLSQEKLQVGLAVSLHASDDALRDKLVPINREYNLEQLIRACQEYSELKGRRLSFEYVLFEGINDSVIQAQSLSRLLKGMKCHVNLIAANRNQDGGYRPSSSQAVLAFESELKRNHIVCTVRQPRGLDIGAGCGQLRSRHHEAKEQS
ncbi:MAG: 23S rRNA (adenine(2503)-C(2))-methyltransferase RlmN [Dehalococcoidales bacterium]|jgi:23S rRNA (adenine2503-C2)-methyltransferase|nr:23S rRNA (adenine(2503)-C(2))-methyltransferase RlmN [Dehalococcoidales bacterium]MDP7524974.1 23S rRNA (adenine(2503)-C(2))-methyltransferase RlmN [Dehalococcoidales bacterium]